MHAPGKLLGILFLLEIATAPAATVKDRAGAVLNDRASMAKDARWIYNDYEAGFKLAATQAKPLLVVLRCVPCLGCAGIDASVLTDPSLAPFYREGKMPMPTEWIYAWPSPETVGLTLAADQAARVQTIGAFGSSS